MAKTLSIFIAGDGETTFESVKALVNDFIGVTGETEADGQTYPDWDEETEVELTYALTGDITPGFVASWEWSGYAGVNYSLITGPSAEAGLGGMGIYEDAENIKGVDDVGAEIVSRMVRAKSQNKQPYLFVLWGDENTENPELEDILAQVLEAELPALDLTAGLDEISFRDTPDVDVEETQGDSDSPGRVEDVQHRPASQELVAEEKELTEDAGSWGTNGWPVVTGPGVPREAQSTPVADEPDEAQAATHVVQTTYPRGEKLTDPYTTGVSDPIKARAAMEPPRAADFAKAFEGLARLYRWQAEYEDWMQQNNTFQDFDQPALFDAPAPRVRDDGRVIQPNDPVTQALVDAADKAVAEAQVKRGRGRPRKPVDPSAAPTEPKKRGRPRKVTTDE